MTREPQHLTALRRALGRRLAHRCEDRGVTQQQLGSHTGYSRSSISHIVAGRQTPDRRDFWITVDTYLGAGGHLLAAYDEYAEAKHRHYEQEIAALTRASPGHPAPLGSESDSADDLDPLSGGDPTKRRHLLKTLGVAAISPFTQQVDGIRQLVLNAAHSSALLNSAVDTPGIEPHTLDEARHDLRRLATDYVVTSSLARILSELVILRDRLYVLLDRHGQRPTDARELHLLLGATCVLLASISHDLAEPRAALIQTRTALTFAELAGHRSLMTWVYCTRAMVGSWWGKPEDVLHHAHQAQAVAASGIAAIRLAGLQARALAQLGNSRQAVHLLQTADNQRDRLEAADSLHELGEVFTFPRARQHYYNAATHLHLGNWAAVGREANTAIDLYGQPAAPQCWAVTLTLARIYLAQSRLHESGPEGTWDALTPVFTIPVEQRIPQTTQALHKLHHQLRAKPFASLPAARDLDEAIHTFSSTARARTGHD